MARFSIILEATTAGEHRRRPATEVAGDCAPQATPCKAAEQRLQSRRRPTLPSRGKPRAVARVFNALKRLTESVLNEYSTLAVEFIRWRWRLPIAELISQNS